MQKKDDIRGFDMQKKDGSFQEEEGSRGEAC